MRLPILPYGEPVVHLTALKAGPRGAKGSPMTSDAHRLSTSDIPDINGLVLLEATRAATDWLAAHRDTINALNVFPVPDGDTGTNMLLTLREAVAAGATAAREDSGAGFIAAAIARGAFIGARGNSGVILCQMIQGFAQAIA